MIWEIIKFILIWWFWFSVFCAFFIWVLCLIAAERNDFE